MATLVKHTAGPDAPTTLCCGYTGSPTISSRQPLPSSSRTTATPSTRWICGSPAGHAERDSPRTYTSDLAVYDTELDIAVKTIEAEHPGLGVAVAAHSTGGLITALWLDRRRKAGRTAPIVGQVLDSPWFDLHGAPV